MNYSKQRELALKVLQKICVIQLPTLYMSK